MERKYPRPTDVCEECKGGIVLCWGEKVSQYWRHLPGSGTPGCTHQNESIMHKLAKDFICEYLNAPTHPTINVVAHCAKCGSPQATSISVMGTTHFAKEVADKERTCVWDVAELDNATKAIVRGVEVMVTHRADPSKRVNIPWVEIDATSVIRILDVAAPPPIILLNDIRPATNCTNEFCGMSLDQMAIRLGYLRQRATERCCVADNIRRWAVGTWFVEQYWDNLPRVKPGDRCMEEFLKRAVCIKCGTPSTTRKNAPFCKKCWNTLESDPMPTQKMHSPDTEGRRHVRSVIGKLMAPLPEAKGHCDSCKICGKERCEDKPMPGCGKSCSQFMWWFGRDVACCCRCLEAHLIINNIPIARRF